MKFQCTYDFYPQPSDPQEYLRHGELEVLCWAESMSEVPVARIAFDHLDLTRAQYHDQDLWQICDSESAVWAEVHQLIFQAGTGGKLKDEFEVDGNVFDILLLHRALFHPSTHSYRQLVLDQLSDLFGPTSVTVLWRGAGKLSDTELADLGFRLIAGSQLCLRVNMRDSRFSKKPEPDLNGIVAPEDAGEWLDEKWGAANQ